MLSYYTCFSTPQEILLCGASFKNDLSDRRVILYLNDCGCGRKYCRERAAYQVNNHLRKVCLKDAAVEFLIEYAYIIFLLVIIVIIIIISYFQSILINLVLLVAQWSSNLVLRWSFIFYYYL